jgi:hypothetical protein
MKLFDYAFRYCEEIERFMRSIFFVGVFTTIYNISMLTINLLVVINTFLNTKNLYLFRIK